MEIAIISGKGGTGKSTISAAFASMTDKVVLADCDVDTANMYILFKPTIEEEKIYIAGQKAVIDYSLCTSCGLCERYCRFSAIKTEKGKTVIEEISCDGCQLCFHVCPVKAISMVNNDKSRMYSGSFRNGKMVYGRLAPGEENSGKLVNLVREKAKHLAKINNIDTVLIDGPPGIGCPVISSITGVDAVIIVTEPTISGLEDLKRAMQTADIFGIKTFVIINKYDINENMTGKIENYCKSANVTIAGKLFFDPDVVTAMINCISIYEHDPNSLNCKILTNIWKNINSLKKYSQNHQCLF